MKRSAQTGKKSARQLPRRICFVTGTRAEFGLMRSTLNAIADHSNLLLQIVVTGMHLDHSRGDTFGAIRSGGWKVDAVVRWPASAQSQLATAVATGHAIASLAKTFERLASDIVLVTGDRVEAFAAASAAHIGGRLVAHVHGGDRALGQVDDSLRHAITKLAHIHFPATAQSAGRIVRLGEDKRRIFRVGSPGLDDIRGTAAAPKLIKIDFPTLARQKYGLVAYHPETADEGREFTIADRLLKSLRASGIKQVVVVYPNNDPGSNGIVRRWELLNSPTPSQDIYVCRNLERGMFLGLMRDAALLIGNSSSGIVEAASFGTPVIDVGDRQLGREHGPNVVHVAPNRRDIEQAVRRICNVGRTLRFPSKNVYGGSRAGAKIARVLAQTDLTGLDRKLIAY